MARARLVKPSLFTNEDLGELPLAARYLFIGLWCLADKEGRLEDRPKKIAAEIFPYDRRVNAEPLLDGLAAAGFICRYKVDGNALIWLPRFKKHQRPHPREADSKLPPCPAEELHEKDQPRHDLGLSKVLGIGSPSGPSEIGSPRSPRSPAVASGTQEPEPLLRPPIFKLYADAIGTLGPMQAELLKEYEQEFPETCIRFAFREAASANIRRLDYVKAILDKHKTGDRCNDEFCVENDRPSRSRVAAVASGPVYVEEEIEDAD